MEELFIKNEDELLELAYNLGKPTPSRVNNPLIDNLVPLQEIDANKQSLSANYGINDFPFHTDGAYFKIPPRYIILRYLQGISSPTPTLLINLEQIKEVDKQNLKFSIWKVKSRSKTFLSTILSDNNDIFRYDQCTMRPLNERNDNRIFFENLIGTLPKTIIEWELNKTVIIDNWKNLHSRPKVKNEEINYRTIQRILIQ